MMPMFDDDWQPPKPKPRKTRIGIFVVSFFLLVLIASLIWPAKSRVHDATRRMKSSSYLKQLGLAIHNYDSEKGRIPPQAICDKDGKKLLSWRVAILPYIEQDALYAKFKLDEPWDSPHNIALIPEMPLIYCSPSADRKKGLSNFKVFIGKGAVFEMEDSPNGWRSKHSVASLTASERGCSNLIFCVESDDPVIWTKPEDWDIDPDHPLPTMKTIYPHFFMVGFGDGRVQSIRKTAPQSAWRAAVEPESKSKESLDQ